MNIGDAVVVKAGMKDPDMGIDIGGWQGRVSSMEGTLISIGWDSVTLNQMPIDVISICKEEGWDWRQMNLEASEVEQSVPRDTEVDIAFSVARLENKHAFDHLGEEGKIVRAVLGTSTLKDLTHPIFR